MLSDVLWEVGSFTLVILVIPAAMLGLWILIREGRSHGRE